MNYSMKLPLLLFNLLLIVLFSCEKKEKPVPKHESGDVTTTSITLGETYTQQVYFDLLEDKIVAQNEKQNWDLAFESYGTGEHILLNGSKAMAVITYENTPFDQVEFTNQTAWEYDAPSGDLDSTAIGAWQNKTYLVHAGYDDLANVIAYYRFEIKSTSAQTYEITYQLLPNGAIERQTVTLDQDYNFVQFSFAKGQVQNEPKRDEFDLLFTQYTHVFPDKTPYTVTGVLTNTNVEVTAVDDQTFESITAEHTVAMQFEEAKNIIGYEWKEFSFDTGAYTVFPEKVFVIKTADGRLYKFHFIDFYDGQGVKGTPTFEYQQL